MTSKTFVDFNPPVVDAAWLNDINSFYYTLFGGATTAGTARTAIGAAASGALASSGITGAAASGANTDITSLNSPALGSATATTQSTNDNSTKTATTAYVDAADLVIKALLSRIMDFRLTLTTGTPITTSDITGASTIYCTPYVGNRIALYNGTTWDVITSTEFSLALGTLTSTLPYDVFCYNNAGVATLEFLAWTNNTTRATALIYQDGILVKTGATSRRYLGTFYTTATTTTEDSLTNRYLWNYYNRVDRIIAVTDTTNTWSYTTATWRQANNNTANQLNFIIGVVEDLIEIKVCARAQNNNSAECAVGIGKNSTSVNSAIIFNSNGPIGASGAATISIAELFDYPIIGRNYYAWLEISTATGTTTWYGDNGGVYLQSGIIGSMKG